MAETRVARTLDKMAVPDPVLAVQPDESATQLGKEVHLVIVDGRLRAAQDNVFKLEYDPKVLQFKRLGDAAVITPADSKTSEGGRSQGAIAFRLARPSQHAPRSVTVTFIAKAPGVSPVRVEVARPAGEGPVSSLESGEGVVRVR
jgi:general secretion pathway protein D